LQRLPYSCLSGEEEFPPKKPAARSRTRDDAPLSQRTGTDFHHVLYGALSLSLSPEAQGSGKQKKEKT